MRAGLPGYTAADHARDFTTLAALRAELLPATRLGAPGNIYTLGQGEDILPGLIFGPRSGDMLALVGGLAGIVEYHDYTAISTRCPLGPRVDATTALDAAYLDGIDEPSGLVGTLRDAHAPGKAIWLTESGRQSCGDRSGSATGSSTRSGISTRSARSTEPAEQRGTHRLMQVEALGTCRPLELLPEHLGQAN